MLKKKFFEYSWADVTAFMVIIGLAFGLIEDIPYAVGASPIVMIVRGVTMGHIGYGFVMDWFYGKGLFTGKKIYRVLAFVLSWLIHGVYDFSLTPELFQMNDNLVVLPMLMAILEIVLLVLMFRFFIRARKIEKYNQPVLRVLND